MLNPLFLGTAIFACCGKPHLIYAGIPSAREEAETEFTKHVAAAQQGFGPVQPGSEMLTEVPALQFMQLESFYHQIELPEPDIHVVHVQSREQLDALLDAIGAKKDDTPVPTHAAPETKQ